MSVFNRNNVDFKKQPMFFGEQLNTQRFDEFKYPIFDNLTQRQLSYFWRPEEISLQKDRNDYQALNESQKHIFTSNLKYQILLDSVQGRGPALALLPHVSLPELDGATNPTIFGGRLGEEGGCSCCRHLRTLPIRSPHWRTMRRRWHPPKWHRQQRVPRSMRPHRAAAWERCPHPRSSRASSST